MRLIDADEIVYESINSCDTSRHESYYGTGILAVRKEDLDNMPTIEECKPGRWIEMEGLDVEIRCTMCTNPMRSDKDCDGFCQYDEKLYKQIMSIIEDRIDGGEHE